MKFLESSQNVADDDVKEEEEKEKDYDDDGAGVDEVNFRGDKYTDADGGTMAWLNIFMP